MTIVEFKYTISKYIFRIGNSTASFNIEFQLKQKSLKNFNVIKNISFPWALMF
jgi:hypothetical protein